MTTLTTDRLILRPLSLADTDALIASLGNLNVSRWTGRIPYPYGPADAEAFIARGLPADALMLAITTAVELIGVIGIEADQMGYGLAEPHWGKGYGTEAARAMADHAFEVLNREELNASYHLGNAASRRILLGLGFVEIGEGSTYSMARQAEVPNVKLRLTRRAWAQAKERRR